MGWTRLSGGHRLEPIADGPPEATAAILHDFGPSTDGLRAIAERWAATVPTTEFVTFDSMERTMVETRSGAESPALAGVARHLARFDAARLVLVGFRDGGTLALQLALRHGWSCAGILAFAPRLAQPLPRGIRTDAKIRLIESADSLAEGHANLRDAIASMVARGIDARGVLLAGSALSDAAIRHGGAYLGELVATAQRADQFHILATE